MTASNKGVDGSDADHAPEVDQLARAFAGKELIVRVGHTEGRGAISGVASGDNPLFFGVAVSLLAWLLPSPRSARTGLLHSFVSLLSSAVIPIEDIARLVDHANTRTTEKVYRKELRPVPRRGAKAMDDPSRRTPRPAPPNLPPRSMRTKQRGEMIEMRFVPGEGKL
jgi:hypothetical protein